MEREVAKARIALRHEINPDPLNLERIKPACHKLPLNEHSQNLRMTSQKPAWNVSRVQEQLAKVQALQRRTEREDEDDDEMNVDEADRNREDDGIDADGEE